MVPSWQQLGAVPIVDGRTTVERGKAMFDRGTTSKVMIGVTFAMTGFLLGLGVQPTAGMVKLALATVALIMGVTAVLALQRHSDDEYKRGRDLPTRDNAHVLS